MVLDAKMGNHIVTARRRVLTGTSVELTDGLPSNLKLDLSPLNLKPGSEMVLFSGGVDTHRNANDYRRTGCRLIRPSLCLSIFLRGGGFAAKVS